MAFYVHQRLYLPSAHTANPVIRPRGTPPRAIRLSSKWATHLSSKWATHPSKVQDRSTSQVTVPGVFLMSNLLYVLCKQAILLQEGTPPRATRRNRAVTHHKVTTNSNRVGSKRCRKRHVLRPHSYKNRLSHNLVYVCALFV